MATQSRRRALATAALCAVLAGMPGPAQAWGDVGHRIIATIAYARLTPAARAQADALLAADTDSLTAPDFASRATWADRWRDHQRDHQRGQDGGHYEATRAWHFANVDIDGGGLAQACPQPPPLPAGTWASQGPARACVVDKVKQFQAELRNPAVPQAERLLALKYLLHLVGDLHQPLHVGSRQGDSGGNLQKVVNAETGRTDNLHSYWDRQLIQTLVLALGRDARSAGLALNRAITPAEASDWASGDAPAWAQQSSALARAVAYDFSGLRRVFDPQGGQAPYLDSVYEQRALPVVRGQLSKAGLRLAAMLNEALP